MMALIVEQ